MISKRYYLDDIAIGDVYQGDTYSFTKEAIIEFAKEFDPQPFHTDEVAAENTFFKGLAASGWHTASATMNLMVNSIPFEGGLIGAGVTIDWPNVIRPGDTITAVSEVKDITMSKSKPEQGIVFVESRATNQKGELVCIVNSKCVHFKKPVTD